jgi:photosystem II stability/assembly factor-like uncharacterized protein
MQTPFFYVSHDGGSTWKEQSLNCGYNCVLEGAPQFIGRTDGWIPAEASGGSLLTHDGGLHWALVSGPFGAEFLNSRDGYALEDSVIEVTHDGGLTWIDSGALPAGGSQPIGWVDFLNTRLGWATPGLTISSCPSDGCPPMPKPDLLLIWQTTDGGQSWTRLTPNFS